MCKKGTWKKNREIKLNKEKLPRLFSVFVDVFWCCQSLVFFPVVLCIQKNKTLLREVWKKKKKKNKGLATKKLSTY